MGPGNPPAVPVCIRKSVPFGSNTVQKSNPLLLGRPNANHYPSSCEFCQVCLDLSCAIPHSSSQVFLYLVGFRHGTANHKMFTSAWCSHFLTDWLLWLSEKRETHCLTHPEHESQQHINDFWSRILGNLSGNWIQTFINVVMAAFKWKRESDTLHAAFWKWASIERQQCVAMHHC
jgi:hypothetical protein